MQIQLQQFQGPLDLLLSLIEKQKIDISEISLAKVTDQYLNFLDQNKNIDFYQLVNFLEIASRLIVLKTRILLPYLVVEEDDEEYHEDLVDRLKIYQHYLAAAKNLQALLADDNRTMVGRDPGLAGCRLHVRTQLYHPNLLHQTMIRLLKKTDLTIIPQTKIKKIFNIKEKIQQINNYLKQREKCLFSELINQQTSKIEVIVSFLALLELCKMQVVLLNQKEVFREIKVIRTMVN
jgi:segregation and condensation protein A